MFSYSNDLAVFQTMPSIKQVIQLGIRTFAVVCFAVVEYEIPHVEGCIVGLREYTKFSRGSCGFCRLIL